VGTGDGSADGSAVVGTGVGIGDGSADGSAVVGTGVGYCVLDFETSKIPEAEYTNVLAD
jgi:hypothetical protein